MTRHTWAMPLPMSHSIRLFVTLKYNGHKVKYVQNVTDYCIVMMFRARVEGNKIALGRTGQTGDRTILKDTHSMCVAPMFMLGVTDEIPRIITFAQGPLDKDWRLYREGMRLFSVRAPEFGTMAQRHRLGLTTKLHASKSPMSGGQFP